MGVGEAWGVQLSLGCHDEQTTRDSISLEQPAQRSRSASECSEAAAAPWRSEGEAGSGLLPGSEEGGPAGAWDTLRRAKLLQRPLFLGCQEFLLFIRQGLIREFQRDSGSRGRGCVRIPAGSGTPMPGPTGAAPTDPAPPQCDQQENWRSGHATSPCSRPSASSNALRSCSLHRTDGASRGELKAPGHGASQAWNQGPSQRGETPQPLSLHSTGAFTNRSNHTFHSLTPLWEPLGRDQDAELRPPGVLEAPPGVLEAPPAKRRHQGPELSQHRAQAEGAQPSGSGAPRPCDVRPRCRSARGGWIEKQTGHRFCSSNTKNTICVPNTKGEKTNPPLS